MSKSEVNLDLQRSLKKKSDRVENIMCMMLIVSFIIMPQMAISEIYKYKNENGGWVFTDSPIDGARDVEVSEDVASTQNGIIDLDQKMREKYRPKNSLEEATLGTVTIKSAIGSGSGFFISDDGYIITNKHVIRVDKTDSYHSRQKIETIRREISQFESKLSEEQNKLDQLKKRIESYKRYIDTILISSRKKTELEKYHTVLDRYRTRKMHFQKRKKIFYQEKQRLNEEIQEFDHKIGMGRMSRHFTAILKDNSEFDVYLISVSQDHDLALLKLDGYKTPFLHPKKFSRPPQGTKVYAIGSPIGIRDSLSSGILSGYTESYIRTDAKIYPGNSGGPLVTSEGHAIGINTFKKITYKYEGLGFAIPIETALEAFRDDLKP